MRKYRAFKVAVVTVVVAVMPLLCACEDKPYKVYWSQNALYMEMHHPVVGLVEFGRVDWGDVRLSDVMEDVLKALKAANGSGLEYPLYLRFVYDFTDMYGNPKKDYDDFFLVRIPYNEAVKYQDGKHLDNSYGITRKIMDVVMTGKAPDDDSIQEQIILPNLTGVGDTVPNPYADDDNDDNIFGGY